MPDEITPAPGETPPASPAPAGNPGTPPEKTPDTPPKDPGTPPKSPEKVSNATHARLRIAERALQQKRASEKATPPPDDGIDPTEREIIEKVAGPKIGNLEKELSQLQNESDIRAIREDVDKSIKESPYGEHMNADEKDKVHQLALDPNNAHLNLNDLITLSIAGRIAEIGASMAKKASEKIKESRIPTSGSAGIGKPEATHIRTPAEWAQERSKHGFR